MKCLILLSLVLCICSCSYDKLSNATLEKIPYQKDDVLVFHSNKNEVDTVIISAVNINTAVDDPLAIFPNKFQVLHVLERQSIIEIDAGTNEEWVYFKLRLGNNKLKYPGVYVDFGRIEMSKGDFGRFNKFAKIEAKEHFDNMKDVPFDLRYIYWNNEFGYLGLEFEGGYIWTLTSFIRDGKDLLE